VADPEGTISYYHYDLSEEDKNKLSILIKSIYDKIESEISNMENNNKEDYNA